MSLQNQGSQVLGDACPVVVAISVNNAGDTVDFSCGFSCSLGIFASDKNINLKQQIQQSPSGSTIHILQPYVSTKLLGSSDGAQRAAADGAALSISHDEGGGEAARGSGQTKPGGGAKALECSKHQTQDKRRQKRDNSAVSGCNRASKTVRILQKQHGT